MVLKNLPFVIKFILLTFLWGFTSAFSLLIQPGGVAVQDIWAHWTEMPNEMVEIIIWEIRFPRIISAWLIGGALAVSGAVLQVLVRNPLAEPYILGISSGASVGSLLPIALGMTFLLAPVFGSFVGSMIVMMVVYSIGKKYGKLDANRLLLGGVMISAFFSSVVFILISWSGENLKTAISWLMGSLSLATPELLVWTFPFILIFVGILFSLSHSFNQLLSGETVAEQVGIPVDRVKKTSYICVSFLTSLAVCLGGIIGFIGLVVPHISRQLTGYDHRKVIPVSFLGGGLLLLISDWLARSILFPMELPVGAVTAILGAPFFLLMLKKQS